MPQGIHNNEILLGGHICSLSKFMTNIELSGLKGSGTLCVRLSAGSAIFN